MDNFRVGEGWGIYLGWWWLVVVGGEFILHSGGWSWMMVGLFWLVLGLFWVVVGGGRWWWVYFD